MNGLQPGSTIHGFRIESVSDLAEFRGKGIRARHLKTGLDLFHLHNDDEENLFSFVFKTPPKDNSGVAHIVEHAVLAGSRRYPIKDPFLVLLKGSLNTFLNAMTYPDKTAYPGASTVKKDYYNLMSVYGDAVFFPLLRREIFHQEGVRLQAGDDGLEVSGVVFNEMQGNYSSFESIVGEWSYRGLFPDSSYGFDSGGEPPAIRELTYEEFTAYHAEFYHPSNCRVFLYGNIPTAEQLEFLDSKFLADFEGTREVDARISSESAWDAPRTLTVDAPVGSAAEGEAGNGASILISWRMDEVSDPIYLLAWEMLAEMLLGNPGSLLYKALMDSQLGEDLSPSCGLDTELRDLVFCAGLRGISLDKREDLEATVFGLLTNLVAEGIPEEIQEAAMAHIDFRHREIRGGAPFGLRLMSRAMRGWLHNAEPESTLRYEAVIGELKERLSREPDLFLRMINEELLENHNRVVVSIRPDEQYHAHHAEEEKQWLANRKSVLGPDGLARLEEDFERMTRFQQAPDNPEDLAAIPCVTMDDLPREVRRFSLDEGSLNGIPFFTHETFTNGVAYLDLAIDISGLSTDEYLLLPLFSKYLCNTGYPGVSHERVATLLSRHSGGFYSFLEASERVTELENPALFLYFRIKALEEELPRSLEIIGRLLSTGLLDDRQRLKEELFELRNHMRSSVTSSGHSFAALRSARSFSPVLNLEENWRGIEQFLYVAAMTNDFDDSWEQLSSRLESLRGKLLTRSRATLNLTAAPGRFEGLKPAVENLMQQFPAGEANSPKEPLQVVPTPAQLALIIPSTVNYSAVSFPASRLGDPRHADEVLVSHILKVEALWEKIRMEGGAYGAFASANATEGVFTMASYRDPHTHRTLKAFRESLQIVMEGVSPLLLEKAVISVVGRELRPLAPGEEGMLAFRRRIYGIADDMRQEKREQLLSAYPERVQEAAAALMKSLESTGREVLVTSSTGLEEDADELIPFRENSLKLRL